LLEAQYPEDEKKHPPERRPKPAPVLCRQLRMADTTSGTRSDIQRGYLRI
jgi:hypothetical protein